MDPLDRQDGVLTFLLGPDLFAGTLRLFLCFGVLAAAGGIAVWLIERH